MNKLNHLLQNNRRWADEIKEKNPDFFETLSKQQSPEYLWIGCSDSRVPANEIVNLLPGELFVHRNVSNIVVHTDLNCLSVIQFAVDVLKVKHIIVCGHYGCGGVRAALENSRLGLIDNWLRHIQDIQKKHQTIVETAGAADKQVDCLCELNVIEQVLNVSETTVVREAWARGESVTIHGWIYGLRDGIVRDLNISISNADNIQNIFSDAVRNVGQRHSQNV